MALTDYVGATARISIEKALALRVDRWGFSPKLDGCYARISLDRRGRIANILSRAGRPILEARDLIGILAGPPDSVLHGELEAHTEAGNRVSSGRGWRALHVFDVTRHAGRDASWMTYADRYTLLQSDRERIIEAGLSNPWVTDDQGDAHDAKTGRYVRPVPRDVRRLPLVPLYRGVSAGEQLWRQFVEVEGGEGLVAVRLDAPARARGAKKKIKQTDTIDAVVIAIDANAALLDWRGHMLAVSARGATCRVGDVVEVKHDGWYEHGVTPRFARIVRNRPDLH